MASSSVSSVYEATPPRQRGQRPLQLVKVGIIRIICPCYYNPVPLLYSETGVYNVTML